MPRVVYSKLPVLQVLFFCLPGQVAPSSEDCW